MSARLLRLSRSIALPSTRHPRHALRQYHLSRPVLQALPTEDADFVESEEDAFLEGEPEELLDDGPPVASPQSFPKATSNPLRNARALTENVAAIQYHLHVTCTSNNTLITLTNEKGEPVPRGVWTGGSCGFKGMNRSGYEAGYQCAVRAFKRMEEVHAAIPGVRFEILLSKFGPGRDAVSKALMTSEGDNVRPLTSRMTDNTPIKIGGTRAKKARRL